MKPYLPRLLGETIANHADRRHAAYAADLDARIAQIRSDPAPAVRLLVWPNPQIGDGRWSRR